MHLTRDDSNEDHGGASAVDNFRAILDQQCILAVRAHCLHHLKLSQLDRKQQQYFKVACFTETPLSEIHQLTKPIAGRSHDFEPFGFVFRKEFLFDNGAEKAVYINGYTPRSDRRKGYDRLFEIAKKTGFKGESWRVLPYVNKMDERYDFAWEREWRVNADVSFDLEDLVCVILPDSKFGPLKFRLSKLGIAYISPGWSYERIVESLAQQKRSARSIALPLKKRLTRKS